MAGSIHPLKHAALQMRKVKKGHSRRMLSEYHSAAVGLFQSKAMTMQTTHFEFLELIGNQNGHERRALRIDGYHESHHLRKRHSKGLSLHPSQPPLMCSKCKSPTCTTSTTTCRHKLASAKKLAQHTAKILDRWRWCSKSDSVSWGWEEEGLVNFYGKTCAVQEKTHPLSPH